MAFRLLIFFLALFCMALGSSLIRLILKDGRLNTGTDAIALLGLAGTGTMAIYNLIFCEYTCKDSNDD